MEQIIATHTIKPSSPTPLKLKIHKLSFLDQIIQPGHIPLIFFYKNDQSKEHTEISRRLRQSLSKILTIFYPMAGTIKENSFVDCNDRGVVFVEAKVHVGLAQFLQDPKMEELQQLVSLATNDDFILSAKVSYFECGGFAVGVYLSHKLGDMSSFTTFMNAWAATCRGETSQIITPSFDMALHFPPTNYPSVDLGFTKQKTTTKRLVFEREMLEKIRKHVIASSEKVKDPSRVEALSAFIWQDWIDAYKSKSRGTKTASSVACHAVDLRPRAVPPIPDHTFGNCAVVSVAVVSREEDESARESGVHLSRLRAAIRAVDDDYINNVVKDSEKFLRTREQAGELLKAGHGLSFTSWWKFPMYDVDFGWGKPGRGKPVWVCTTSLPYMNSIILMSTPSGDGIEAWGNVSVDDDQFFQLLQANCNKLIVD